jgi:uncharacterized protein (TIGR02594 family)
MIDKDSLQLDKPRRTPDHPTKSHVVKTRVDGKEKIIRFGEQGASTAGKPKQGESERMTAKRASFKSRHAKNIAKGKSSAAYWANKVKWATGGSVELEDLNSKYEGLKKPDFSLLNSFKGMIKTLQSRAEETQGQEFDPLETLKPTRAAPTLEDLYSSYAAEPAAGIAGHAGRAEVGVTPSDALSLAASQMGLTEGGQRAAIQDYLTTGGANLDPATTAWCAAFVNSTLQQTGVQGTGSNMARSFLDWGQSVDQPQEGDLAVFSRGDANGPYGHVGFFKGYDDQGNVLVLGGNQGDAVSISPYPRESLLGFRRAGEAEPQKFAEGGGVPAPKRSEPETSSLTGFPEIDRMIVALGNVNQMFNPVEAIGESMDASKRMLAPDTPAMGRVAALGDMLSGVGGVVAPVATAARAGTPAAAALMESLLGGSPTTTAMGDANKFGEGWSDAYHWSRSPDDFTEFDPSKSTSAMSQLGPHVGTKEAANARYMGYADADGNPSPLGFTVPLKADLSKQFVNPSTGEPWSEMDLEMLVSAMADEYGVDRRAVAPIMRDKLAQEGYTSIPYVNDIEDAGNISHIMLTERPSGQDAVLRSRFAKFDPSMRNMKNLGYAEGGGVSKPKRGEVMYAVPPPAESWGKGSSPKRERNFGELALKMADPYIAEAYDALTRAPVIDTNSYVPQSVQRINQAIGNTGSAALSALTGLVYGGAGLAGDVADATGLGGGSRLARDLAAMADVAGVAPEGRMLSALLDAGAARDVGSTIVERANQRGPVPVMGSNFGNVLGGAEVTPGIEAADRIADMLRTGRADEITDELADQADPQRMMYHYTNGNTGMDLPMDYASRMERSKQMGFDTSLPLYHGTTTGDIKRFRLSPRTNDFAIYSAKDPAYANEFAGYYPERPVSDLRLEEGSSVIPLFSKGEHGDFTMGGGVLDRQDVPNIAEMFGIDPQELLASWDEIATESLGPNADVLPTYSFVENSPLFKERLEELGMSGVDFLDYSSSSPYDEFETWNRATLNPADLRSKFARFDPRLGHLSHLDYAKGGTVNANFNRDRQRDDLRTIGDTVYERRADGVLSPLSRVKYAASKPAEPETGSRTGFPEVDRMLVKLGNLNEALNPMVAIQNSQQASRRMFEPNISGWDRLAAAGDMLSNVAGVVAPAALSARAGVPAATALIESLVGGSPTMTAVGDTARDVGRKIVERANQRGPVPVMGSNFGSLFPPTIADPYARRAADRVAEMLRMGREDEITDELLEQADPQVLMRHYTSGNTGMDMPMDYASRMARAKQMGFGEDVMLHGTPYKSFSQFKPSEFGAIGPGVYVTKRPVTATDYARGYGQMNARDTFVQDGEVYTVGGNVVPVRVKGEQQSFPDWTTNKMDNLKLDGMYGSTYKADDAASRMAEEQGFTGVQGRNENSAIFNPTSLRSQFARFDPRLSHLGNLSAGVAAGAVGLEAAQYDPDQVDTIADTVRKREFATGGAVEYDPVAVDNIINQIREVNRG